MTHQVIIKPTFLLKGIDPYSLNEEYKTGCLLINLNFEKKKITPITLLNNRGKSFRDAIYTFRNRDNFNHTIATTGIKNFNFVNKKGETQQGGICSCCRKEFTHQAMGIPVCIKEEGDKILIFTLNQTCDFRCTLKLIRILLRQRRRINLMHAEQFLFYLYRKMHPNGPPLREAPDPFLLDCNDGSLIQEEFIDQRYTYVPVPNLIFYPAKEQYLRITT